MNKKTILAICMLLPAIVYARKGKDNLSFYIRNALAFNKQDVSTTNVGTSYLHMNNTMQQSIGLLYKRSITNHIIASGGLEFGYERYKGEVDFPFDALGFRTPVQKQKAYNIQATIPYVTLHISVGYRLKPIKGFTPELRIGQSFQRNSKYNSFYGDIYEQTKNGYYNWNLVRFGTIGSGTSFINYLYAGTELPAIIGPKHRLSIGLQFQKRFLKPIDNTLSYTYLNATGNPVAQEEYRGTHTSLSLIAGITF